MVAYIPLFPPEVRAAFLSIGQMHIGLSFGVNLVQAIFGDGSLRKGFFLPWLLGNVIGRFPSGGAGPCPSCQRQRRIGLLAGPGRRIK